MRNANTITIFQVNPEKAKQYIQLQDKGVSQTEAAYRVFGNKVGDDMVRLHQHEIILDQPNLN